MPLRLLLFMQVLLAYVHPLPQAYGKSKAAFREARCDIPTGEWRVLKQTDLSQCKDACSEQVECKAFVHISGWNRCRLMTQGKPQFAIRFHSAQKAQSQLMQEVKIDQDYTGKDLRKIEAKNLELCLESCRNTKECLAVTYIEGYQACWLKKTAGRFLEKIFTCGEKI
jgi:hypothetical protein